MKRILASLLFIAASAAAQNYIPLPVPGEPLRLPPAGTSAANYAVAGCTLGANVFCVGSTSAFAVANGGSFISSGFDFNYTHAGLNANNTFFYGWSASTNPGAAPDTTLCRASAGVTEFGTSACGTAGSWSATNGTLSGTLSEPAGAATTGAVTISSSATDTKVVELALPTGYLNTANKVFRIEARGIYTTTGIAPTLTFKVKLCTVSGCGSGTVLTLYAAPATGATTSGASNTWIVEGPLGTITTGSTGTVMLHAQACTVLGATGGTACTPTIDANTAASSTIDLTAALFLDVMVNASAVTTLTVTPNVAFIHPAD
jgi:hypothetical protein